MKLVDNILIHPCPICKSISNVDVQVKSQVHPITKQRYIGTTFHPDDAWLAVCNRRSQDIYEQYIVYNVKNHFYITCYNCNLQSDKNLQFKEALNSWNTLADNIIQLDKPYSWDQIEFFFFSNRITQAKCSLWTRKTISSYQGIKLSKKQKQSDWYVIQ